MVAINLPVLSGRRASSSEVYSILTRSLVSRRVVSKLTHPGISRRPRVCLHVRRWSAQAQTQPVFKYASQSEQLHKP